MNKRISARLTTTALGVASAVTLIAAGCSSSPTRKSAATVSPNTQPAANQPARSLRVGALLTLTGGFGPIGQNMLEGIKLAVQDHNAASSAKVTLYTADDQLNPQTGVEQATRLVQQDHVEMIVGITASNIALALAADASRLGVPIVTTNAADDGITGKRCSAYVFRTVPSDAMTTKAEGLFLNQDSTLKARKWFAVAQNYAYGQSQVADFQSLPGLNKVGSTLAPLSTSDWSGVLSQIKASGATGVYSGIAVGTALLQFLNQAVQAGLLPNTTVVPAIGLPDNYVQQLGSAIAGLPSGGIWLNWTAEQLYPTLKKLNDEVYKATGHTPNFQTLLSYIGTEIALDGLTNAKSTSAQDVIDALANGTFNTALGPLSFRKGDHQLQVPVFYGHVKKLASPQYGASYAFQIEGKQSATTVMPSVQSEGCELR